MIREGRREMAEEDEVGTSPSAEGDDLSWLLADDDPFVGRNGAADVGVSATFSLVQPADVTSPSSIARPVGKGKLLPGNASRESIAVGSAFQPLPGRPLLSPATTPLGADAAVLIAELGTPVHAVRSGVVAIAASAGSLQIKADGIVISYQADDVDWTFADGEQVAAGAIVGIVRRRPVDGAGGSARSTVLVTIADSSGKAIDAVAYLAGLADPAELGVGEDGTPGGLDPFPIDLRLGGSVAGPGGPR